LDGAYNLEMLIEHTRSYHADYEMDDGYKVISWGIDPATGDLKNNGGSKYIYSDYPTISLEDIAQSSEFYLTYVADKRFKDNLKLTLDYMTNYVRDNIWNKVL
jgi:hypothetical protein